MAYEYITQYSSPNHNQNNSGRSVQSITIHWWGSPSTNPTFQGTVNYLCRPDGNTSAHYVAEAGRVACIVDPDIIAWHAGNNEGNRTSIGIECNPRQSEGDYATIAELVRDLRNVYGDLPLYPHNHWKNTQCPGTYDLAKIDRLARSTPGPSPVTPTPEQDDEMLSIARLSRADAPAIFVGNGVARKWVRTTGDLANLVSQMKNGAVTGGKTEVQYVNDLSWLGEDITNYKAGETPHPEK